MQSEKESKWHSQQIPKSAMIIENKEKNEYYVQVLHME